MSSDTRFHSSVTGPDLEKRNDGQNLPLIRREYRCHREVVDEAMHDEPQRAARIDRSKIQFQVMQLCVTAVWKRIKAGHIAPVAIQQQRQHIAARVIDRRARRTQIPAGDNFELRKRRLACEILVRIDDDVCRDDRWPAAAHDPDT